MIRAAIDGMCDSRLQRVRDAFAENFARHGEVGAAVSITVGGQRVVDLWAGHADAARTRPWTRDTIINIASATKGLTAICAHRLVDRGLLDRSPRTGRNSRRRGRRPYRCIFSSAIAPACPQSMRPCRPRHSTTGTE